MAREESVDEILQEYRELNGRLKEVVAAQADNTEDMRGLKTDMRRLVGAVKRASDEGGKGALLVEIDEAMRRWQDVSEEDERLARTVEELGEERNAIKERLDVATENLRAAALETERMLFELGKLVATLDVAAIVAMSAVTPALLPRLDSLTGLWPALGWLLVSVAVSVVMCFYSIMNVSRLVARGSARRGGSSGGRRWLPRTVSGALRLLPYPILLTFSAGALLIGVARFALFVSRNLG